MKTEFKNILDIIGKITDKNLFNEQELLPEEKLAIEDWAGKSLYQIKEILSPDYCKRQLAHDPFTNNQTERPNIVFKPMSATETPAVNYGIEDTSYGRMIIASTDFGVCFLSFYNSKSEKLPDILPRKFPGSIITRASDDFQQAALAYINGDHNQPIHLHVRGSEQELIIWKTLATVPPGKLISYGALGKATNTMAMDVGAAMGDNGIALLIPCHLVIKTTGELGGYHYGTRLKQAILIRETPRSRTQPENISKNRVLSPLYRM